MQILIQLLFKSQFIEDILMIIPTMFFYLFIIPILPIYEFVGFIVDLLEFIIDYLESLLETKMNTQIVKVGIL